MDSTIEPKRDVRNWNETRWNGCWNADDGVGLYLHAGRYRHDLDMWWAQVVAYLPDGRLCVDRVWGRSENRNGITIGAFDLTMTEDGWTAAYDGVGELTTSDALARGPRGASSPVCSMRFSVTATAAAPVWDMYADSRDRFDFAGDSHVQQGYTTVGELSVGDGEHRLDGIGFKDHSSGPRDFARWYAHRFFLIVTEAWTCHAVVMYDPSGTPLPAVGAFFRNGEQQAVSRFELPELEDAAGGPVEGELEIELANGECLTFASELVHALPVVMTMDNDYVNGIDWELQPEPGVLIEGIGRLTAPDGTTAWCHHERSAMRSRVRRPVEGQTPTTAGACTGAASA